MNDNQLPLFPSPFFLHPTPSPTHTLQDGTMEVAVKVIRKEFFKQDPKVRENLVSSHLPAGVGGAVSQGGQVGQFHLDALQNILPCISLQEEKRKGLTVHCVVCTGRNMM